jgi:type VI protein secretion system component Hcp
MDKPKTDTVMRFIKDGNPVLAECTLDVNTDDKLMEGFKPASGLSALYANFFEVQDFDFGMALEENDKDQEKPGVASKHGGGSFTRWREPPNGDVTQIPYKFVMDKFSFKKVVDRASPIFFQACCYAETFDGAVLVKRISQGDAPPAGVLRMEFSDVLITGLDWDDGELVNEKCEFTCRKLVVTILAQGADGKVQSSKKAQWTWWPGDSKDKDRFKGIIVNRYVENT